MNNLRPGAYITAVCVVTAAMWASPALHARTDAAEVFKKANTQYASGEYRAAAENYRRLLRDGHGSAWVYFNLGNTYARMEEYGLAVLQYRRALLIAPRNGDIRHNLEYVKGRVSYQPTHEIPTWWHWVVDRVVSNTTLNELLVVTVVLYWLTAVAGIWWMYTHRRLATALLVAGLIMVLVGTGLCVVQWNRGWGSGTGIVIQQTPMLSGPGPAFDSIATLPDGAEVALLSSQGQYREVRTEAGGRGWVSKESVRHTSPYRQQSKE
ncbi:MAG: tetratricopeptide repeat protein [Armatimonadota bacterium]